MTTPTKDNKCCEKCVMDKGFSGFPGFPYCTNAKCKCHTPTNTEDWEKDFIETWYCYNLKTGTPAGAEKEVIAFIKSLRQQQTCRHCEVAKSQGATHIHTLLQQQDILKGERRRIIEQIREEEWEKMVKEDIERMEGMKIPMLSVKGKPFEIAEAVGSNVTLDTLITYKKDQLTK